MSYGNQPPYGGQPGYGENPPQDQPYGGTPGSGYGQPGYGSTPGPSGAPGYGAPGPSGAPGYGAPGPSGYGNQPPYSGTPVIQPNPQAGYGAPGGTPGWAGPPLASWVQRVLGYLIDYAPVIVVGFVVGILSGIIGSDSAIAGMLNLLFGLAGLAWYLYNNGYMVGTTGQSLGKRIIGIKVLAESNGQVIGGGAGVLRALCHILDSAICYLGFLWPLWDAKRQTFADKIMSTVAINVPPTKAF